MVIIKYVCVDNVLVLEYAHRPPSADKFRN